jgi:hypothetical protein
MSPSTVLRPRAGEAAPWRSFFNQDVVAIVVAAALALAITLWVVDSPTRVTLTVVNPTDYELTIAIAKPGEHSWLPLTVIDPGQERLLTGTIDQGPEWLFRFSAQARDGGEVAVTRDELGAADWRFEVPPEVVERLESAGATPPPR